MERDEFFGTMRKLGIALTFDDVSLGTAFSEVLPHQTSLETMFSRRIPLKIPFVSAAMDTVTECEMAIAMAKKGGIGVIHRNLEPEEQARQVARVKHFLHGKIHHPITCHELDIIEAIETKRRTKGYQFHSFPVENSDGKLVGLITGIDIRLCRDPQKFVREIMTSELVTASPDTTLERAYEIMCDSRKKVLPLVSDDGRLCGMYTLHDVEGVVLGSFEDYNLDSEGRLRVAAAIGTGKEALSRAKLLVEEHVDALVIDTAHGDSGPVYETLHELKEAYPEIDIVAGNVSEGDSAFKLVFHGADGIKVGQGAGSICTTRKVAGVGCPQLTAVYECVKAVEGRVPVCADGGIGSSGDIVKAISAGASCVMLGRILAGTDETPGKKVFYKGVEVKMYRGMGSESAMRERPGSMSRYNQINPDKLVPEGVSSVVPYRGKVDDVIDQYLGGLRSGMGYTGAATISELRTKTRFWRVTNAGVIEARPHDVTVVEEGSFNF